VALTIDSREVRDAADLYRRANKDVRRELNRATRQQGNPWLQHAIRSHARLRQDVAIANTARLRNGNNPAVVVGGSGRIGSTPIRELVRQYEFGGMREHRVRYATKSRRGKTYPVLRRTQRQLPWYRDKGRMVYPSLAETAPRIVSMWLGILTGTYREATGGR
jgi:hypothetical protein